MRAQVALVAAVAHRPELLLLDEPSTGLDAVVRKDILNAIVRTVSDDGRTVIFSSHLLEEVERMSDHVTMIHEGKIALEGTLETVTGSHRYSNIRFAHQLVVEPHMEGVLSVRGSGRSWTVVHTNSLDQLLDNLRQSGGELIESRIATLEEIFAARVGRVRDSVEAE